jgi:hypothetical protein
MTADDILRLLVSRGRYASLNDAWRTFLRWALIERQLPEADCLKALEFVAEGERQTATGPELAAFKQWFAEFQKQPHVQVTVKMWAIRPGQSSPKPTALRPLDEDQRQRKERSGCNQE